MKKPIYFKDLPILLKVFIILIFPISLAIALILSILFGLVGFLIGFGLFLLLLIPAILFKLIKQ